MSGVDKKDVAHRAVVGTFQVKLMLTDKRELILTGHVYDDDTAAEINQRVDAYQDVADRQSIRCDLVVKRARIEAITEGMRVYRDQLTDLAEKVNLAKSGKKNPDGTRVRVSSQEEKQLENGWNQIRAGEKEIESLKSAIKAAEAKLTGGG